MKVRLPKCIRWLLFKRKLLKGLPKYNSNTGSKYAYTFKIKYLNKKYNKNTGKLLSGFPRLVIIQHTLSNTCKNDI